MLVLLIFNLFNCSWCSVIGCARITLGLERCLRKRVIEKRNLYIPGYATLSTRKRYKILRMHSFFFYSSLLSVKSPSHILKHFGHWKVDYPSGGGMLLLLRLETKRCNLISYIVEIIDKHDEILIDRFFRNTRRSFSPFLFRSLNHYIQFRGYESMSQPVSLNCFILSNSFTLHCWTQIFHFGMARLL